MNINFVIQIQLVDSSGTALELKDVSIDAVFYVQARVRYRFHAGVTDARGRLVVTFEQLEKTRLENQAISIMDYNTLLQDCDPQLGLIVPSSAELQQRQAAKQKWFPSDVATLEQIDESNNGKVVCETVCIDVDLKAETEVLLMCGKESKRNK